MISFKVINIKFTIFKKSSLSGHVLSFKGKAFDLDVPKISNIFQESDNYYIVWKINIKKILSADCHVKFIIKQGIRDVSLMKYLIYIYIKVLTHICPKYRGCMIIRF